MSSNSFARARMRAAAGGAALLTIVLPSFAATDLAAIEALPQRGQSADQTRRDRFECHNWAVGETGIVPPRFDPDDKADRERGQRVDRVVTGAGIGAAVGGLVRATQDENPSHGVLTGGVIGAAVGALVGRRKRSEEPDPQFDAYFRALSACLEGRGYQVFIAGAQAHSRDG